MSDTQNVDKYSMYKVVETIAGTLVCTILVFGNSSNVIFNENSFEQNVVHERQSNNLYESFTAVTGISYDLPGYTFNNMETYMESIFMDNEKINNIEKLDQIAKLEDDWDGEGARSFSNVLIQNVKNILMSLKYQPEVFPTACDTIQIEYERENGSYLEIEISTEDAKVFAVDSSGKESISVIKAKVEEIDKVVNCFYG